MFKAILGRFSKDMGIDLGTANTLVYVKDRGIVINEPSVVAINEKTDQILAVGHEAKQMVGKTPQHITAVRPLSKGVVSDFEVTEKMLKHFIERVHRESFTILPRPRVVIAIPLDVTEVERKAVEDATYHAGAREVFLIEEPIAAAIGSRIPIQDSVGNMIVDIGGGTCEIAVISLGGIVSWRSIRMAGDELTQNIITHVRDQYNLLLGEKTAEYSKIHIGSVVEEKEERTAKVRGRDLISGLPKEMMLTNTIVRESIARTIRLMIDAIKITIEDTPPELLADIYERGLYLSGGTALLTGLDKKITQETGIPSHIVSDPLTAVVRGCGLILEDIDSLKDLFLRSTHESA